MNIGFDAKRAYHNATGLGYYSRTLIKLLGQYYPENRYYLFNPKRSSRFHFESAVMQEVLPSRFPSTLFRSAWRSSWVTGDLRRLNINLYHGLSHEIPIGINKTGVKSVVTIHDLIHERYPGQYNRIDVKIYRKKYVYACQHADRIIAISQQTKQDIVDYYGIDAGKIEVCYQSCSPVFSQPAGEDEKKRVTEKYGLPPEFILSVGTINERKNLLGVCKAMFLLRNELNIPLLVIGKGTGSYYQQVKDFILQHGLEKKIIFLSEQAAAKTDRSFLQTEDLVAIYQLAQAVVYPSFFEGFGLPVIEALSSGTPVITSNLSCLPEVGGDAAYYVDPNSAEEIAEGIKIIYRDSIVATEMIERGRRHAQLFAPEKYVQSTMNVYRSIC